MLTKPLQNKDTQKKNATFKKGPFMYYHMEYLYNELKVLTAKKKYRSAKPLCFT